MVTARRSGDERVSTVGYVDAGRAARQAACEAVVAVVAGAAEVRLELRMAYTSGRGWSAGRVFYDVTQLGPVERESLGLAVAVAGGREDLTGHPVAAVAQAREFAALVLSTRGRAVGRVAARVLSRGANGSGCLGHGELEELVELSGPDGRCRARWVARVLEARVRSEIEDFEALTPAQARLVEAWSAAVFRAERKEFLGGPASTVPDPGPMGRVPESNSVERKGVS